MVTLARRWMLLGLLGIVARSAGAAESSTAPVSPPPAAPSATAPSEAAPAEITWHATRETLTARVPKQRLSQVLPRLARATSWQVFLEPGTDPLVSSTFSDLPAAEALERLLNGQDFALRTGKDGRSRLLVYRTTAGGATEEIAPEFAVVERVANELLVKLRPGAVRGIEEIAASLKARVVGKVEGQDIYRLRFENAADTEAARGRLAADADVAASGDNLLLRGPEPGDWKALGSHGGTGLSLRPSGAGGKTVIVGLIDTAVRSLGPEADALTLPAQSVVGPVPEGADLTHGTVMLANILHGAQITLGRDREADFRVLPVNVYSPEDPRGRANLFDVLNGTQLAIQQGATLINWSLSSPEPSPVATQFTRYYASQGITFLAAAGNQPVTDAMYPAADPGVVAVTAVGRDGNYAGYANRGSFVDVGLPGSDLVDFGTVRYLVNGTSTATAFGSGILAARAQQTGAKPPTLVPWLTQLFPPPGKR